MFHFEDPTETQLNADEEDELVMLDDTTRQQFLDNDSDEDDHMSITLFDRIRKLI